jgi:hypothetical protein
MRHVKVVMGIAVAVVALALSASPAFAKVKEKHFFGEFTASITGQTISPEMPAVAKGQGSVTAFKIAGTTVECGGLSGLSEVTEERSTSLKMSLSFKKCSHADKSGEVVSHPRVIFKKPLVLKFHANGSARVVTIEENEAELKIRPNTCKYHIPEQEIPLGAEKNPEKEYEAAEYATEEEPITTKSGLKKFPSGIRERLNVTMAFKHIATNFKPTGSMCEYVQGEEDKFNPVTKEVETSSKLEAELEEITLKNGSIGFDTTP